MTIDISNFYLMTPLNRAEFIRINLSDVPNEVINECKLRDKATKVAASTSEPSMACTASHK
jgi:hypothetical protein